MEEVAKNIFTFPITLPENPLKWLNCYVIRGGDHDRNLLIDTGFHRPECVDALLSGMERLHLLPEKTDVFLTHLHSDHSGNAALLQSMGCRILMGSVDYEIFLHQLRYGRNDAQTRLRAEGMPEDVLQKAFEANPAVLYASDYFSIEPVKAGDVLAYGEYHLQCISTPGHTPGHLCLYDREHEIMFTSDHVLFDITPNISAWPSMEDALGTYLESLCAVLPYEVKTALPAHRNTSNMAMRDRIYQLLRHHEARLAEMERIIADRPGLTGYQIAGLMTWKIHCSSWDDFPPAQKWFAMSETISHLDYLVIRERIMRIEEPTGFVYSKHYARKPPEKRRF